jgi:hypothetical protein
MEISTDVPQTIKIEQQYVPALLLLSIYPKECKSVYNRHICSTTKYEIISFAGN